MDIGYNRKTGIASMVEYLRETDQMGLASKIRGMTFKKYIKSNTIENAIDYGATDIQVVVKNGGKDLISIIDFISLILPLYDYSEKVSSYDGFTIFLMIIDDIESNCYTLCGRIENSDFKILYLSPLKINQAPGNGYNPFIFPIILLALSFQSILPSDFFILFAYVAFE